MTLVVVLVFSNNQGLVYADQMPEADKINFRLGGGSYSSNQDCTNQSSTSSSGVISLPTGQGLSQAAVDNINKLKPDYMKAAASTGVPWQVLAAIHYREGNNNPNQDLQAGNPLGGGGSQASTSYGAYGAPATIEESATIAAKELIGKAASGVVKKPVNVAAPDADAIKDALFGYNGRASVYASQATALGFDAKTQPYEGSPYVMNNFDAKHANMKIITKDFGGLDGVDKRLGAFTVYALLLQADPSTASTAALFSSSGGGCTVSNFASSKPVDCTNVSGNAKILCAAKGYDNAMYVYGAGHQGPVAWKKTCPTVNSSCALDCSSLVSVAIYDAFGVELNQTTYTQVTDSAHWKKISFSEVRAGDIVQPDPGHVEIVDYVEGKVIHTFGAHNPNLPPADQVGPTAYMKDAPKYVYLRYVGQGASN